MRERERKEREGEGGGNVSGERTAMKGGGWSEGGKERGVGVSEGGKGERERPRRGRRAADMFLWCCVIYFCCLCFFVFDSCEL